MDRASPKLFFLIALLGTLVSLVAQNEEPSDDRQLPEIRDEFRKNMREAMATNARLYITELRKLERELAASEDFEGAIGAREERLSLEKFLGDAVLASSEESGGAETVRPEPVAGETDLQDTAADVADGGQFNDRGLDLSEAGAIASWAIGELEPGGYEVELHYTLSEETEVQVQENFFRLSSTIPPTDGKQSTLVLGTLKITDSTDTLNLVHTGERSDLIIHSIQLRSAKQ